MCSSNISNRKEKRSVKYKDKASHKHKEKKKGGEIGYWRVSRVLTLILELGF